MAEAKRPLQFIQELVDEQAADEGLWFQAETAPEAYLQQELRRLHAMIEQFTRGLLASSERPTKPSH